jgi:hypothetical protein
MTRLTRTRGGLWVPRQTCRRLAGPATSTPPTVTWDGTLHADRFVGDDWSPYDDTDDFLTNFVRYQYAGASTITGPLDAPYDIDHASADTSLVAIDPAVTFNGVQTFRKTFPAGVKRCPSLASLFPGAGKRHWWLRRLVRRSANFKVDHGDAGNPDYKNWAAYYVTQDGRIGGSINGPSSLWSLYANGGGGTPYDYVDNSGTESFFGSAQQGGLLPVTIGATAGDEAWYLEIVHHEVALDGKSELIEMWVGRNDGSALISLGPKNPVVVASTIPNIQWFNHGLNYNHIRDADPAIGEHTEWIGPWDAVDGTVNANPYGVAA